MDRRELGVVDALLSDDLREQIAGMARDVAEAGVAPLDIKPGHFLRGATTGRPYWIDFEMSRLASQPDWHANLTLSTQLINEMFDLKQARRAAR